MIKNFNPDSFPNDLKSQPWADKINSLENPNDIWNAWKNMFDSVADKRAPLRDRRVKDKHSPWLTSQIRKLIIERDLLKKKAIKTGEPDQWKEY